MDYAIKYSGFLVDSDETKSTSGYVFTLGGGAVTLRSAKQTIIARSTMEPKFVSLEMAESEVEWLKNFLANIPLRMKPTPSISIHCDCQSAIAINKNKTYNENNRLIQLRHNLVKQLLKRGKISIYYVKLERNLADPLTKPLRRNMIFETLRGMGFKQTSEGNPTFVIGDPMNKVHMGKNKSLVSSASTKLI